MSKFGLRHCFVVSAFAINSVLPLNLHAATAGKHLQRFFMESTPNDRVIAWVFFADKGAQELKKATIPLDVVSPRSLERRKNTLPSSSLVDYSDLPIDEGYVRVIALLGVEVRERTKWFNGISVSGTAYQLEAIMRLPFVREVELVGRFKRDLVRLATPAKIERMGRPQLNHTASDQAMDYGLSLPQVNLLNIPPVHALGNHAEDVLIGVFDNGWRLPNHESLKPLRIVATYDFVDRKTSVVPIDKSASTGDHGVKVLSVLGGYKPGVLVGPAYGAKFILARTENDSSETPAEEDKWVAAIEWAESLGVQVTNTSLGYLKFDPPSQSWTWEDMDGKTTVISRAATMAARKGVVVVNSAGNENLNTTHNTLNAPADADSIIAVGAVTPSGTRASFSSVGPTTSIPARIKPDVMATGTQIVAASATDTTGYSMGQGTSYASPLTAGVAAMLVKAHPKASPALIIEALKATASNASVPNNQMGWGIINALAALNRLNTTDTQQTNTLPNNFVLSDNFPNPFPSPFNPATRILYSLPEQAFVTLKIFDVMGREILTLVNADQTPGVQSATWDARNAQGITVASGTYIYRLEARGVSGTTERIAKRLLVVR